MFAENLIWTIPSFEICEIFAVMVAT
jgi:hypothetical protein